MPPSQKLFREPSYYTSPIKVIATNRSSLTPYGLLDNASRGTILRSDIANRLGLKGRKELVSVNTVMEKTNGPENLNL